LLDCLPEPPRSPVSPRVLEGLDEGQLQHLLRRDEIALKETRRKVFTESANISLRRAAVASKNFEWFDTDISQLIPAPGEPWPPSEKKTETLAILAEASSSATLVQLEAIHDLTYYREARESQSRRAKSLSQADLAREILEMRLYHLAKVLNTKADQGPDRKAGKDSQGDFEALPAKLKTYLELVTPNDRWATYLNLRKALPLDQWKRYEADLPGGHISNLPENRGTTIGTQVFDLANEVRADADGLAELNPAELSAVSAALTTLSAQMQKAEASTSHGLKGLHRRVNLILWVIGAVLLLLVFKA
jgi:hypothetical protein